MDNTALLLQGCLCHEHEELHPCDRVHPAGNFQQRRAREHALCPVPGLLRLCFAGEPAHLPHHPGFPQPPHPHVFLPGEPGSV